MDILFIADPLASFKIYKDTTFAMMREAQKRGHHIFACEPHHVVWQSGQTVNAQVQQIHLTGQQDAWFDVQGVHADRALHSFDAVVMRKDPPFDSEYFYATHLLEQAEREGAKVFNKPSALRNHPEKLAILEFAQFISPTLVTRDAQAIRAFHAVHRDIILKPLDGMGGMGIFRVKDDGLNLGAIIENRAVQAALLAAYVEAGGQVQRERLVGLTQATDAVQLQTESGTCRTRLLVGADGAASRVRELAGITATQRSYGEQAIVATVRSAQPHRATAWQSFLATGPLALLPLADGQCSIVWSAVDAEAARRVAAQFLEVLIAPSYTAEALAVLSAKTATRVLRIPLDGVDRAGATAWSRGRNQQDIKRVGSGLLIQGADDHEVLRSELKVVTRLQPTEAQWVDLLFAWKVAKYVKSNAIVFCGGAMTLGVGAGQMSRIDSARIASIKAANAGLTLAGSAVASDAFFPFRDGLDVVCDAGATSVIHPGGSVRDGEVIAAADERGIAMVLTGVRHFRH